MKTALILIVLISFLALPALAHKAPGAMTGESSRIECGINDYFWVWDGTFTVEPCDTDGLPVWQYGIDTTIPQTDCDGEPIGEVLGTVLGDSYPSDAGERAYLGTPFDVTPASYLLEICHFYDIESSYDGGNVELILASDDIVVIDPIGGYPDDLISDSTNYYAWCVDMQPGFTGHDPSGFVRDCFDLSQFMGETVQLAVKFGSDSSVAYPGWFISSAVVGGETTATELGSWSTIKALF